MNAEKIRVLFCDHLNLARGKIIPAIHASGGESRFCQGIYALTYDKDLVPAPCSTLLEGLPDMIARYDLKSARHGWVSNETVVIAEQYDSAGNILPVSGRAALARALQQWKEVGYDVKVGIELEAYVFTKNQEGKWIPCNSPGAFVYGTGICADPLQLSDTIYTHAEHCGFDLELITTEFDSPQFEFTLRFDDAMAAADDAFLFRLMAREVAMQQDILLTFMPKPILELSGSGVHVNFSLWDEQGNNATGDATSPDKLSAVGKSCVAGLMHHHRALAGLLAPTVNSYQRLQPASLSGYWRNWGEDHRGVTARVTSETGDHARIEHRMADGAANPYTAVAAVLQAARLGRQQNYELQPAETGDCLIHHDAEDGVPDNLSEAISEMQADTRLVDAIGPELIGNLAFVKQDEVEKTANMKDTELRDFYIHYI